MDEETMRQVERQAACEEETLLIPLEDDELADVAGGDWEAPLV